MDLTNGGKMNFYIADTHFGHKNIIRLDNRPFLDMIEMEGEMVRRWNNVVGKKDDVVLAASRRCASLQPPQPLYRLYPWQIRQRCNQCRQPSGCRGGQLQGRRTQAEA